MFKEKYFVVGVMSGTSLDGVDLAHIVFTKVENEWSFEILKAETVPYSVYWLNKLQTAVTLTSLELRALNNEYTSHLATVINDFIKNNAIKNLDAVCSHGHTVLHQPQKGITLQIGNLPQLATLIQQKVLCDFRVQDVALGGQGAPLVPIGDRILFSSYDYCMNLGGFSNISFEKDGQRIAFDISPVNTVLNFYAQQLGFEYDDKGAMSRSGNCYQELLDELNALEFYSQKYPKSLGFEFVKGVVLPLIEKYNLAVADKMNTFTEHVALQIAAALPAKTGQIFVTGGGAYNDFLIERAQSYLPKMQIIIPDREVLEFKEAVIFGLLGVLKLRGEINVLCSVTGAQQDHSAGMVYKP
ncbi:anhydro-N-acetylmuramic acid kinase [Flavobacterium sp. F-328]|jgi:anhydro-N-acetylmuramic acid kinase|uniref:Anhydro-N-acetylmuramic acid kinase n=1 Tax=Flavobacterium erciyesense TaxID=2825842 RepID=A0ABS5D5Z6_9FLAO|nr:anhydro-N-acetylmuramic acid kinase [Flavobacterium erciyesense]MBQ0909452.1 anhydro-N-acetylmuramic acid kinase [Flavobacterium erciyesense]